MGDPVDVKSTIERARNKQFNKMAPRGDLAVCEIRGLNWRPRLLATIQRERQTERCESVRDLPLYYTLLKHYLLFSLRRDRVKKEVQDLLDQSKGTYIGCNSFIILFFVGFSQANGSEEVNLERILCFFDLSRKYIGEFVTVSLRFNFLIRYNVDRLV